MLVTGFWLHDSGFWLQVFPLTIESLRIETSNQNPESSIQISHLLTPNPLFLLSFKPTLYELQKSK